MCEATIRSTTRMAAARPRWGALYALTLPSLVSLVVVDATRVADPLRATLRCVLALSAFAGMAVWIRRNRGAVDLQAWCDCAHETLTVREIPSRRPAPPVTTPPSRVAPREPADTPELVPR